MTTLQPAPDIPVQITSSVTSSERRINPSWTIAQFKARLETVTGIPASSQRIILPAIAPSGEHAVMEAADEGAVQLGNWRVSAYDEITVQDTRPAHLQQTQNLTDPSASNVPKYEMPHATYESLPSTVLAYKKTHGIGRFAPDSAADAASAASSAAEQDEREIAARKIAVGARCQLLPADTDARRGRVAYVGLVDEIPASAARKWVGVVLDEPTGKNDGRIGEGSKRYFECGRNFGVFVRPERVEVGDFRDTGLDDDELGSDMEEI